MKLKPTTTTSYRRRYRPAPSPIKRTELLLQQMGASVRDAALEEIIAFLGRPGRTQIQWAAHIWLAGTAFGAALDATFMGHLCNSLSSNIFTDRADVWLEYDTTSGLRRWVADPITALLILDFRQAHSKVEIKLPARQMEQEVARILKGLKPLDSSGNQTQRKQVFFEALTARFRRFLPGVLLAHATGQAQSAALPRSSLLRATGSRLSRDPPDAIGGDVQSELKPAPEPNAEPRQAFAPLKRALAQFLPSSRTGGTATGSKAARRTGLDAAIQAMESAPATEGPTERLVLGWLRQLIRHGPQKQELETSTIQEDAHIVIAFARTKIGRNVLTADAEEVEEVLHNLIDSGAASSIQKRVTALRHFHDHIVRHFHAEPVDWSVILQGLPDVIGRVDANLIYWHEVIAADQLIQNATHVPESIRLCARFALHLMWPTGTRFGEAYRSRLKDFAPDLTYALVRPTEHGDTKSSSGIRPIPLTPMMGDLGRGVLTEAVSLANLFGKRGHLTPVMGDPADPRSLLPRWQISSLLNEALREATGDESIHAHHLRHGFATRLHDCAVINCRRIDPDMDSEGIQLALLGVIGPSRRLLHAVAQVMGQASPDVSTAIYVHNTEFRIHRAVSDYMPTLGVSQLAPLIGRSENWVYKHQGKSQAALIDDALVLRASALPALDFRNGIPVAEGDPRSLSATRLPLPRRATLTELNELLRLSIDACVAPSTLASLASTSNAYVATLVAASISISDRYGYRRLAPKTSGQWEGAYSQYESVRRTAAGFHALPATSVLEDLIASEALVSSAGDFLRKHAQGSRTFFAADLGELERICRWLAAMKIRSHHIHIVCPSAGGDIPSSVREACVSLGDLIFATKPLPKRGKAEVEVRLLDHSDVSVPALIHATYLWIVRAQAEACFPASRDWMLKNMVDPHG